MWEDAIVAEVRATRAQQGARFNHELWAIYADVKQQERASGQTFVTYSPRPSTAASAPPP